MQSVINTVKELLDELFKIEKNLEKLNIQIDNPSSPEIDKLNELIHQTTHEIATEIGFNREKILLLSKFIDFKIKYKDFKAEDLEEIIDKDNLSSSLKLRIFKGKSTNQKKTLLEEIAKVKKFWNKEFKNKSFKEITLQTNPP